MFYLLICRMKYRNLFSYLFPAIFCYRHHTTATDSPNIVVYPQCPAPYSSFNTNYTAGSIVEVNSHVFVCRDEPYTKYCNIATLDEALRQTGVSTTDSASTSKTAATTSINDLATTYSVTIADKEQIDPEHQRVILLPTLDDEEEEANLTQNTSNSITNSTTVQHLWLHAWTILGECINVHNEEERPNFTITTPNPLSTSIGAITTTTTWYNNSYNDTPSMDYDPETVSTSTSFSLTCNEFQTKVRIELQTDGFPKDISWVLQQRLDNDQDSTSSNSNDMGYDNIADGNGSKAGKAKQNAERRSRKQKKKLNNHNNKYQHTFTEDRHIPLLLLSSRRYERKEENEVREICLMKGQQYEFQLRDEFGDGLCCLHGDGYYKLSAQISNTSSNENEWQLIVAGAQFTSPELHHTLEVKKDGSVQLICPDPQERRITIEILTDNYGEDISWQFRSGGGTTIAKNERVYGSRERDSRDLCVADGSSYELIISDVFGDGMCCAYGSGYYKILSYPRVDEEFTNFGIEGDAGERSKESIDDESDVSDDDIDGGGRIISPVVILHGGMFFEKNITHVINTTMAFLSERDRAWLAAHNRRRKIWHAHYKKDFVPLQWSEGLKAEASIWSDSLLRACGKGMYHDPSRIYGENAAGNSGSGDWGKLRSPEQILTRFVEYELDDPWPKNGHLTQALWRASRYVGCAESHVVMESTASGAGRECHTQVCRYAVTGNCNMGRFQKVNDQNETEIDWVTPMLEDTNYCGPLCPPDGCHA